MRDILIGRTSDSGFNPQVLEQLYRFRYRVFKEKLDWDVSCSRGIERDFYDELDPVYIACRQSGVVMGSWRLLPTTGPYMLRDTFPDLLRGEEAPCASDVWELSRFAIESPDPTANVQAVCSETTFEMLRACYRFAQDNGIREYVTVMSVAMERMMRSAGAAVTTSRLGDGKAMRMGKVLSIACRIRIDEQLRSVLSHGVDEAAEEMRGRNAA